MACHIWTTCQSTKHAARANHVQAFTQSRRIKPWPHGLASRCKSRYVCKTRTCVRTCEGWLAKRIRKSARKFTQVRQKDVNSRTYSWPAINLCRLVSTCVGWSNGEKKFVNLRTNLSSTKVNASHRKSTQVGGQAKRKLNASRKPVLTCDDLRVRLARA